MEHARVDTGRYLSCSRRPVCRRSAPANEYPGDEETQGPEYADTNHREGDGAKDASPCSCAEDSSIEEQNAELDETQCDDLHEFKRPQYLDSVSTVAGKICPFHGRTLLVVSCWKLSAVFAAAGLLAAGVAYPTECKPTPTQ